MKYLSVIEFMNMYGDKIEAGNNVAVLNHYEINQTFDVNKNYAPFDIMPMDAGEKESKGIPKEQVMNIVALNSLVKAEERWGSAARIGYVMQDPVALPPILELEWLRGELDLDDEVIDVLTQMSYFLVLHVMQCVISTSEPFKDAVISLLESEGPIIEVVDLKDTPAILSEKPLSKKKMPKIRSWQTVLLYGHNFYDIITKCEAQTLQVKELYYHLPVLLSTFMVDYFGDELAHWNKSTRIKVEQMLGKMLGNESVYPYSIYGPNVLDNDMYTYGRAMNVTEKDIELFNTVFTAINEKLVYKNKNLGIISFSEYKNLRGPDVKNASVRLSNMYIDWDVEMERAETEKDKSSGE